MENKNAQAQSEVFNIAAESSTSERAREKKTLIKSK